ncbi:hypothetical protein ABZ807_13815 [Micromonospora sp. NPDC047548]|uniref:hypothetical protein n=1 Tax=Micromonospora sp. NPDC047548 TaxID=3155624 RepID=UPI0033D00FB8
MPAAVLHQADLTPRQPAVIDGFELLDYEQLMERAGALAAHLRPVLAHGRRTQ